MFLRLSLPARLRRLFVAAVAVGGLAIGLIPASSAAASAGAARSAGAASLCQGAPLAAAVVWGDPAAYYFGVGGYYKPAQGVAYEITGPFPHSTYFNFTAYNDYGLITSDKDILDDYQIVPDPGSVNPFIPGNPVNAPQRNYTVWLWPDSVPVPPGLHNVILFPTEPADPTDNLVRFALAIREYQIQPGYTPVYPTVRAVSAANPDTYVPCPASVTPTAVATQLVQSFARASQVFGLLEAAPEPPNSNQVLFSRVPADFLPYPDGADGLNPDGSVDYLFAGLDLSKIVVVTVHNTPKFFNNQVLSPSPVMGTYQDRWNSLTILHFPTTPALSVNQDNAIFRPDGSWVTVFLPSEPRLSPSQEQQVRAKAAELHYNVLQDPLPNVANALAPEGIVFRQKIVSPTFCCSLLNVPSWVNPDNPATAHNNYLDWGNQTSQAYFNTYTSNSTNMGPYYINGVKETYSQFMQP